MALERGLRQKLLCHLAALALAAGSASAAAAADLDQIPRGMLEDLLDDLEGDDWQERDLVRLVDLLLGDQRPEVRLHAAQLLGKPPGTRSPRREALLRRACADPNPEVRRTACSALGTWLRGLCPFQQVDVLLGLGTDGSATLREAAARVVGAGLDAPLADTVLEQLARDPEPSVRRAARRAQRRR
jgi:HEAT repeat protein